jgi:hypothetical protein
MSRSSHITESGPTPEKRIWVSKGSIARRAKKYESHAAAEVALIHKSSHGWASSTQRLVRWRAAATGRNTSAESAKATRATSSGLRRWKRSPR